MPPQAEIYYDGQLIGWIETLEATINRGMDPQYAIMGTPEITLRASQLHLLSIFHQENLRDNRLVLEIRTPNGEIFNGCIFTSYSMRDNGANQSSVLYADNGEVYVVYANAQLVCADISQAIPGTEETGRGSGEIRGHGGRAPILPVTQVNNRVNDIGTEARRSITETRWRRTEEAQVATPSFWLLFRDFADFQRFLNNEHVNHGSCTNCLWHKYRIRQFDDWEHAQHCGDSDDRRFNIAPEFEEFREAIRNGSFARGRRPPVYNSNVQSQMSAEVAREQMRRLMENTNLDFSRDLEHIRQSMFASLGADLACVASEPKIALEEAEQNIERIGLIKELVKMGAIAKEEAYKLLGLSKKDFGSGKDSKTEPTKSTRKAMCLSQIGWAVLKEEKKRA